MRMNVREVHLGVSALVMTWLQRKPQKTEISVFWCSKKHARSTNLCDNLNLSSNAKHNILFLGHFMHSKRKVFEIVYIFKFDADPSLKCALNFDFLVATAVCSLIIKFDEF